MNKNICPECSTENEQEYIYCKNCGSPLEQSPEDTKEATETTESAPEPVYQPPQQNNNADYTQPDSNTRYTQQTQNNGYSQYANAPFGNSGGVDFIDGIPKEEISLFIGRKVFEIMPKFNKMELTQSKFSWCWPAAILGFLMGPLGSALWFFYRKMYKPAVILSVIGAILTIITSLFTIGTTSDTIDTIFDAFSTGDFEQAIETFESLDPETTALDTIAGLIDDVSCIATGIICGLLGFYIYKNHCVNKILAYRSVQLNPGYYRLGLPAIGGVSGGMLAIGIAIMVGAEYIASFITTIIALIT